MLIFRRAQLVAEGLITAFRCGWTDDATPESVRARGKGESEVKTTLNATQNSIYGIIAIGAARITSTGQFAGRYQFRSITTSRYSLGNTSVSSPERLPFDMSNSRSWVKDS
jgi:hypothetical protein